MIDDESLVKTRTNICLSDASAVRSYSVTEHRLALPRHVSHGNTIIVF